MSARGDTGTPPAQTDPRADWAADLARYAATVIHGMSVQAAGGATRSDLRRVADLALRAWPGKG